MAEGTVAAAVTGQQPLQPFIDALPRAKAGASLISVQVTELLQTIHTTTNGGG